MPDPHTRMEPSAAPERRSLSTQVADSLRELIISNAFVQGQQLKQHEIAKRLGLPEDIIQISRDRMSVNTRDLDKTIAAAEQ